MQLQFSTPAEASMWVEAMRFETHRHGLAADDDDDFKSGVVVGMR